MKQFVLEDTAVSENLTRYNKHTSKLLCCFNDTVIWQSLAILCLRGSKQNIYSLRHQQPGVTKQEFPLDAISLI